MESLMCCGVYKLIHLIPKWRPINHSFVCMFISPLCLVNMYKQMRERGLINKQMNNLSAKVVLFQKKRGICGQSKLQFKGINNVLTTSLKCLNYFYQLIYGLSAKRAVHRSTGKYSVCNLQYGPRTRFETYKLSSRVKCILVIAA